MMSPHGVPREALRAPAHHRDLLILPSPSTLPQLLARNHERLQSPTAGLAVKSLASLRQQARQELLNAVLDYSRSYLPVDGLPDISGPIIMTGHQPQFFHPGVWMKNMVASDLAAAAGGVAINLIVDSDTMRLPSVHLPTGLRDEPAMVTTPYDAEACEVPYEERQLLDLEIWKEFPRRVDAATSSLGLKSVATELWNFQQNSGVTNLGQRISQMRHTFESTLEMSTWEVPQSHLCDSPMFQRFVMSCLTNIEEWQTAYNRAILNYRRRNKLRSSSHPAPLLETQNGRIETPFWIWTTDEPKRRRLFVELSSDKIVLSDAQGEVQRFSNDLEIGGAELAAMRLRGIKIRSRALMTTLFARVFLADVFIHGIGGAKYDEVTDDLIRNMIGIEPPDLIAATATWQLLPTEPTNGCNRVIEPVISERELMYHPERYLSETDRKHPAVLRKQELLAQVPTSPPRAAWRSAIRAANSAMQPLLELTRQANVARRAAQSRQQHRDAILKSREYPYCAFSREQLLDLRDSVRESIALRR